MMSQFNQLEIETGIIYIRGIVFHLIIKKTLIYLIRKEKEKNKSQKVAIESRLGSRLKSEGGFGDHD